MVSLICLTGPLSTWRSQGEMNFRILMQPRSKALPKWEVANRSSLHLKHLKQLIKNTFCCTKLELDYKVQSEKFFKALMNE